jgi:type IV pilus assembly protein PilB
MLTVPLRGSKSTIGAIQVLNKEIIADESTFTKDDLALIEEVAEYSAPLIQRMLDPNFVVSPNDTAKFVARFTDNELITSDENLQIDEKLIEVVGDAIIRRSGILPYKRLGPKNGAVLMSNPLDYPSRESFQTSTELIVEEVAVAPATLIDAMLRKYLGVDNDSLAPEISNSDMAELTDVIDMEYGESSDGSGHGGQLDSEESAPIIQLANRIIEDAYVCGASDIHIEPQENDLIVRYRIDGVCEEKLRLPSKVAGALVARIKVMAELDIAEKRLPQDGRIIFKRYTKKNIG